MDQLGASFPASRVKENTGAWVLHEWVKGPSPYLGSGPGSTRKQMERERERERVREQHIGAGWGTLWSTSWKEKAFINFSAQ